MKKNKLQELIRQAISEVLEESTIDVSNPNMSGAQKQALIQKARATTKNPELGTADEPVDFVEGAINEMAGANYKLADNYEDKLSELPYFNSEKRMKWVNGIIDYLEEVGASDITKIATEKFNVPQPRIADYARDMIRLGILEPAAAGFVPKFMRPEEEEEEISGPDAFLIGKGNSLAGMFDGKPNDDGSEDFNDSEEPTLPKTQEPFKAVGPVAKAAEFTTDNDRLIQKIINIYGASKLRVREISGDEELSGSDFSKAEKGRKETAAEQLPKLIQQLADKISTEDKETQDAILAILAKKFASVGYTSLSKKIAAALGTTAPQAQEPEMDDLGLEDEIDELDEAYNTEYEKRKLQFYAGIIK